MGDEEVSYAGSAFSFIEYSRMPVPLAKAYWSNFLGNSSEWFKKSIVGFIIFNTILRYAAGTQAAAIALLIEFIFTLVMSLQCYPLQSGGKVIN